MTTHPGDPATIGSFAIQARLGRGAMGAVYLARSPGGRLVAVKVVRDELAGDDGFRARFAREIEAARKVSGAFTAAVVDADPDAHHPWLATEYLPGPTLQKAIDTFGPLAPGGVRSLAGGVAEALDRYASTTAAGSSTPSPTGGPANAATNSSTSCEPP